MALELVSSLEEIMEALNGRGWYLLLYRKGDLSTIQHSKLKACV